jgi:eukaryotic-like serine/threonine-protein kinase
VHIHDYGLEGGQPYMVMELLTGEDLRRYMKRSAPLDLTRVVEIIRPTCKALRLAHDAGIVHRDIKPSNVFLARSGEDEVVKVLDFGIAKEQAPVLAHADTSTNTVLGSPMYMSPEQARAGNVDQRSDLWSVGVVVFELLTGHHPFEGASLGDVFARIISDELPVPSDHGVDVPGLDQFFRRALSRPPASRYATAMELADALAAVERGVAKPSVRNPRPPAVVVQPPPPALPEESPVRRGRESDTLALANTAPGAPGADTPPRRSPREARARAAVAAIALVGVAAVAGLVVWPRVRAEPAEEATAPDAVPAAPSAAAAVEPEMPAPTDALAVPPSTSAMASAAPTASPALAAPPAAPAGASAPRFSPGARPVVRAQPTAAASAPPAAAPTARPDPVFGVPVTKP